MTDSAASLYVAVLDAGDRLADALSTSDLGGAARALDERQRVLDALQTATLSPPSPDLVERFRTQDERINRVLHDRTSTVGDALTAARRAASAQDRYRTSSGAPPSVLDTAPRQG